MTNPKSLVRRLLPADTVRLTEKAYRTSRGLFWRSVYGFPSRGMKVVAVTGTNGKTTTASYINSMFRGAGLKTAVYTTAFIEVGGKRQPNLTHMTVSSQADVQKFFRRARKSKTDWVILEVTSHALDQGRIDGVKINTAVITNLTQEHLDYHGTMEEYAAAKARLLSPKYAPEFCILNVDDEWFGFFKERSSGTVLSFGENPAADLRLEAYALTPEGSSVTARYKNDHITFTSQLIGKFNAYNALAAYAVGAAAGLDRSRIAAGLASLESVPGRMERVGAGQAFTVVVDYAITPDALENVLTALQEISKGRVLIVFGATGDRDATKRAPMGEVVGRLADRIYLTDDETYTEDPAAIRDQVYAGLKVVNAAHKTIVVDDRRKAIRQAFADAEPDDTVLLTGIGHQDYRNMGGKKEPWDERVVAREELSLIT